MPFQFTHPAGLWLLFPAIAWTLWLARYSDASLTPWRRWVTTLLRLVVLSLLILGVAGLQWRRPQEGMNIFFLLDRSDSVPSSEQERSREMADAMAQGKMKEDKAGFLVFGSEAALETEVRDISSVQKIQAVVGGERTDLASAIRLGTAAFPENGQKKLVILSDGNENVSDAAAAVMAAKPLGVTVDVIPLGTEKGGDVSVQKLQLPANLKKGQTFDAKVFVLSDAKRTGTVRLMQNGRAIGSKEVQLDAGKNLFTFDQTLNDPGFYGYDLQLEVPGDTVAQNNRAASFVNVRGDPRLLLVSAQPKEDANLVAALRQAQLEVVLRDVTQIPDTLAELQSYDALFLSNIAAGDLGQDRMRLVESAVRDFGVGLVCLGGDNAFAAGGYRNTPLETTLPLDMELSSKKVLPSGALVLVMHGMEFANGNQVSREVAIAALESLGPQDELGVVLWDGTDRWLVPLQKVTNKREIAKTIAGMNQGDLPDFKNLMQMGYDGLKKSTANLKHMIVFSDGDPGAPTDSLMRDLVDAKVTVSTVMIGGHVNPDTMIRIADMGRGRFYDVKSAAMLPQIFIKEAAVILKSAIFEEPFKPQLVVNTELTRGIGAGEFPTLRGYVATTAKPRAETAIVSEKGDPILAHWQYGLGRAVAFTSDARSKWAADWMGWPKYQQFWSQTAKWAMRRVDAAEFTTEVNVENGRGHVSVEALDREGNFRNFLKLRTAVVSPKGVRQDVVFEQTGPGRYEAKFDTKEVGAYLLNLQDLDDNGVVRGTQVLGASVNYSPEFNASAANLSLLRRITELGGGQWLEPGKDNPFLLGRKKTFQPLDLWTRLLQLMVILFVLDVGLRRVDWDREEWARWWAVAGRRFGFGNQEKAAATQENVGALLAAKGRAREARTAEGTEAVVVKPAAELFQPRSTPVGTSSENGAPVAGSAAVTPTPTPTAAGEAKAGVTSRLLEAKRRAQKKK